MPLKTANMVGLEDIRTMVASRMIASVLAMMAALALMPPAAAQFRGANTLEIAARQLKPGQYLWRDLDPSLGIVAVIVSVPMQVAYVYRGDTLIGVASVSTGRPGKSTPIGDFTILQKRIFHRSNIYSNAPMPHMQRLTWTGIAMHAGVNPGYPASHGCIRLPPTFAMLLYGATQLGGVVAVVDDDAVGPPPPQAIPVLIADSAVFDTTGVGIVTWRSALPVAPYPAMSVDDERWLPDVRLIAPVARG